MIVSDFLSSTGWSVKDVPLPGYEAKIGFAHKVAGPDRGEHSHPPGEHEILLILKGSATLAIEGEEKSVKEGELVILIAGDKHSLSRQSPDLEYVIVMVMPTKKEGS